MKLNKTLFVLALIYNGINFGLMKILTSMNGGSSMIFLLIYPLFWILSLVIVGVLTSKLRRLWFNKSYKLSTNVLLVFCSPLVFLVIVGLHIPRTYCDSTGYNSANGHTYKYESWVYFGSLKQQVIKYWVADQEGCNDCDSTYFKRDSTWIYLNPKQDTMKIDIYKDGKLIREKLFKNK
jgi:hypothetical protein